MDRIERNVPQDGAGVIPPFDFGDAVDLVHANHNQRVRDHMSIYPNSFTTTRNARNCHTRHCFTTPQQVKRSIKRFGVPGRFTGTRLATSGENDRTHRCTRNCARITPRIGDEGDFVDIAAHLCQPVGIMTRFKASTQYEHWEGTYGTSMPSRTAHLMGNYGSNDGGASSA